VPYLWPSKNATFNFSGWFFAHLPGPFTHISQSLCIIILLLGRVVNLAIPLALGELIRIFDGHSHNVPLGLCYLDMLRSAVASSVVWLPYVM